MGAHLIRRWIVPFHAGRADDKQLLGGKGANLCEMTYLGMPVPPGFIVTTEACRAFLADGQVPDGLFEEADDALAELEATMGHRLGDPESPLLLAVRSGAAFSMPGMMDTVLNIGATPATVDGLAAMGDARFAWDARRRALEMYGRVVAGVEAHAFSSNVQRVINEAQVANERELDADQLRALSHAHEQAYRDAAVDLVDDPRKQLHASIIAVFRSWNADRARAYRRVEGLPDDLGTAVTIQAMVFGNLDDNSATGVAFTRDPATGEPVPYGDVLVGAQGEDIVAGTRAVEALSTLAQDFPDAYRELCDHLAALEVHYRDMCDTEFTIERDKLWMLQTRVGKRSATAAVRIAVDMVDEGLISEAEAVSRVSPEQVEQLLHPRFTADSPQPLTVGLAASPGAAVGKICLSSAEAKERGDAGESVILVRPETSPEDVEGMLAAAGLLTSRGGLVSHAAVIARGFGIPAVCGAHEVEIDPDSQTVRIGTATFAAGDIISIDGSSGHVVSGEVELAVPDDEPAMDRLLAWADEHRTLRIYANADTADDARRALAAGAEGIGLCRTEHQFLGDRLPLIQRVILAGAPVPGRDSTGDAAALAELESVQRADFDALFAAMDGKRVVIRLLDPPLHEFLPDIKALRIKKAHDSLDHDEAALLAAAEQLREHDPMLGVRGIRLGLMRPEIYATQVRAIYLAAIDRRQAGGNPRPEIMFPLVSTVGELTWGLELLERVRGEFDEAALDDIDITTATMIETPRAALCASDLAPLVDAFSFGTNDLTQLTFGLSRDDVEATFIPRAIQQGVLPDNPFHTLDADGVVRLMDIAVTEGRETHRNLVTGICGEHAGEPASIRHAHRLQLTHVSCSPARIKVARLAAAHAALDVGGPAASA